MFGRKLVGVVSMLAALGVGLGVSRSSHADTAGVAAGARVYTLARCLELAERNYPQIYAARARLERKRAERREAHTAPFSQFTVTAGLGPAPTLNGTNIYSPNDDTTLPSDLAIAWQVGIEGTIPLWTFGKITNLWDAADANVKVGEHDLEKAKNEVRLLVREAYYGAQVARDSELLIQDAAERIDKYLSKLEARIQDGEGDDIALVKLKMYRAELEAKAGEAAKQRRIALIGLRYLTAASAPIAVPDEPIVQVSHLLGPISRYLQAAQLHRPEVNMARAGVLARSAQARLEHSRYFPDVGLGLSASVLRAPTVTDQTNPFVRDPGNTTNYGAALVMRWKLDFLPQAARVAKAEADLEEMRATERYALGAVGFEVEQAYEQAREAALRLDSFTRAAGFAKQWVVKVQQAIDIGTMEEDEIVDPAKEYALKRFSKISAVYEYNLALSRLALATGWEGMLAD